MARQSSPFKKPGGRRQGAGRKAAKRADGKRVHNPHHERERFARSRPVHVTVCGREGLPNLRGAELAPVVLEAMEAGNERKGFRLVHFSLQTTHWHLICEAEGPAALASAIKGLSVRIARAINKRLGRKGKVIADRYHLSEGTSSGRQRPEDSTQMDRIRGTDAQLVL